jgi:hypothetical protein
MSIYLPGYFKNNKNKIAKNKFVVIIGSGFHIQGIGKKKNILNNWSALLSSIDKNVKLSGNNVLDFEKIVRYRTEIQKLKNKNASQIEKELLKEVASSIINYSKSVDKSKYPTNIFNNRYVSDVINLNYDLVVESIAGDINHIKNQYSDYKISKKKIKTPILSTLYYDVNEIRFWHPHGSVLRPETIQLGIRSYYKKTIEVETLRKRFKSKTRDKTKLVYENSNWFDLLSTRPIIICGASLSTSEWDLWLAIVSRLRNYAQYSQKETPIFKMYGNTNIKNREEINYFNRISNGKNFKKEWILINNLLNK